MKLIDLTKINQLIDGLLDKINEKYATKAELSSGLKGKANASHGTHLTLGNTQNNAYRGDYGNTAYKHSQAAHAPSNAQKNSDITKAEIEAKLKGNITSHTHSSYVNQNAFSNVKVGDTTVAADTTTDTLTLVAGSNVTITPDATNDKITIAAKDTTYSAATSSAAGLMSANDKSKLDGIAAGANKYTHPSYTAKSSGLYKITVDATGHVSAATAVAKSDITALGIPSTNTTYSTGNASTAGLTKLYTGTGTATDGTMTQAAIKTALDAKAASSHGNHFLDKSITTNFNTTFRTSTKGNSSAGTYFTVVRTDTGNVSYAPQYSSGIAWGKGDTHGYLNVNYSTGQAYIGGGSADKLNWVKQLAFTDSSITGNASTATKLQTARTINGTSFNGSANITTANWGTARTLTIGAAGKSVNGSGNVAWSLDEIGAKTRIKKVIDLSNTTTYPVNKWYPCLAAIPYDGMHDIEVAVQLNSGVKPSWANHNAGFTCNLHVKAIAGGWGTTSADSIVLNHTYSHASENPCSYSQLNNSSNAVLWLRGGGKYFVFTDWNASWSVKTASTEISSQTVAPATSCPSISLMKSTMTANLNGNATTATTLQTAHTINGTSFNGSGNITTANWGTARNLTIGNTTKSVNGSANVAWSLSEIGAAPSSSSSLKTTDKTIIGAINEVFQSGNNVKQNLVDTLIAKGSENVSTSNSWEEIIEMINGSNIDLATPVYTVEFIAGVPYGFVLRGDGYYESVNKGVQSSYAMCKVVIPPGKSGYYYMDCINYGENNYDYGLISTLNHTLPMDNTGGTYTSASVLHTFYNSSSPNIQTISLGQLPDGGFFYVKYRKDNITDEWSDSLKFKVRLSDKDEGGGENLPSGEIEIFNGFRHADEIGGGYKHIESSYASNHTIENGEFKIYSQGSAGSIEIIYAKKAINLTNYTTLEFNGMSSTTNSSNYTAHMGFYANGDSTRKLVAYASFNRSTFRTTSINVANLNGEYVLAIQIQLESVSSSVNVCIRDITLK